MQKIMEGQEFVSLDLIEAAIRELSLEQLVELSFQKADTVYGQLALERYDEMLFEVSDEIYAELESKMEMDGKEYRK